MLPTIDHIGAPATIIARIDLNSPVIDGRVQDNPRFASHAETLESLRADGHRVAILAHQGRPGDEDFVSLEQHADLLAEYVDAPVDFCPETWGDRATDAIDELDAGDLLLLENVRMVEDELADRTPDEHAASPFVRSLAGAGDVYVGDAYSTAHRAHASIVGIPTAMDRAFAGPVMHAEYTANTAILSREFAGDVVMVLGGTKADDLIRLLDGVSDRVDRFLIGGVLGELCLRAQGHDLGYDVGESALYDPIWEAQSEAIETILADHGDQLLLPTDLAYADDDGERAEVAVEDVAKSTSFYDIGSATVERYEAEFADAGAVFVKGAVGMFEDERFNHGTVSLLEAIARSDAFSVVGGGDTSRSIELYDLDASRFDHVSIAGGAYLSALAGETLPGVDVLRT